MWLRLKTKLIENNQIDSKPIENGCVLSQCPFCLGRNSVVGGDCWASNTTTKHGSKLADMMRQTEKIDLIWRQNSLTLISVFHSNSHVVRLRECAGPIKFEGGEKESVCWPTGNDRARRTTKEETLQMLKMSWLGWTGKMWGVMSAEDRTKKKSSRGNVARRIMVNRKANKGDTKTGKRRKTGKWGGQFGFVICIACHRFVCCVAVERMDEWVLSIITLTLWIVPLLRRRHRRRTCDNVTCVCVCVWRALLGRGTRKRYRKWWWGGKWERKMHKGEGPSKSSSIIGWQVASLTTLERAKSKKKNV